MSVWVRARFYSPFRSITGVRDWELELPAGSDVAAVLRELCRRFPELVRHLGPLTDDQRFRRDALVLLNDEIADLNWIVPDGSQVALVGPLQGG